MATFHANLVQSFKNFKNKYIGNTSIAAIGDGTLTGAVSQIKSDLTVTNGTTSNQNINYIRTGNLVTFTFNSIASNGISTWEEVATLPINIPNDSVSSAILNNPGQILGAIIRVVGNKAYVLSTTAGPVSGQVTAYTNS